ncbi:high affinity copper uptake protein 1 [Chrysoperla carnea]|uniref:high affinity copper uptake protein 1 n=1 Tax=Chrysoperla carnea TaxID=189513 RepID=UPI001D08D704|nr:high affinity copper uptake protein 1 [Chrysoperla carnea]
MDHSHHHMMSESTTAAPPMMVHDHMDHDSHAHAHVGLHEHPGSGGDGDGCSGHNMMMWFHTGYCETVLFESWKITSQGGLIGSMIGIFFMAALYEGLKYYREYLFWKTYNALQYRSVTFPSDKKAVADDTVIAQPSMISWIHAFQTVLHVVQIVLSYFLMLIFMTYNIWLCAAVVIGAAVGYFLFGWKKSVIVDVTEHCH